MTLMRRHLPWALSGLASRSALAKAAPLRVAAESFPPFTHQADGRVQGLDVELVSRVMAGLGQTLEISILPWKRALLDLEEGVLDAVLGVSRGGLNEREEMLAFPDEPLSTAYSHFYFRADRPFLFDGLFTLKGKRVAVLAGYRHPPDFSAASYFQREASATHEQSLRKLLAGRVDLALVHAAVGEYLIQREGWSEQLRADAAPIAPGRLYMGFSRQRGHALLAERFGLALQRYKRGPEYRQMLARYGLRPEVLAGPQA
ncbi:polar amino acid transport system substrate-binding protein [Inhella inkyongensis]|uniref:Polar amino acid transport system substrate-binding protein n=1 Tax=Inhella inkyongensis TaxID=392593 RepID=A0A840S5K4_9BURK|nr:transporter substrate-binding domain-containing protein [Inhella inkyongensis]MBB5204296.1 polar amino acid transport system substrate-binding protein [Inhella inkyongensis]